MNDESFQQQLVWLLQKSRAMVASREVSSLISTALDALLHLSGAQRAFFFDLDSATQRPVMHSGKSQDGQPLTGVETKVQSAVAQALADKRSMIAADTDTAQAVTQGPTARTIAQLRVRLLCCLPLINEGEPVGVLYADAKDKLERPMHSRMLELLADHVAVCLDNARMFEKATGDLLTGLPNNSYFLFHLTRALQAVTPTRCGGVLLLDIDAFKRINAAAGAEMGDRALVDMAHTLHEVLRADGLLARYGSDKFGILLPPEEGLEIGLRMRDVAERARAAVGTKSYHGISMSASIGGIAFTEAKAHKASEVVAMADDVLRRARARGRGQVEVLVPAAP